VSRGFGLADQRGVDVRQCGAAVYARLALAEQVEVGAMEDQNLCHAGAVVQPDGEPRSLNRHLLFVQRCAVDRWSLAKLHACLPRSSGSRRAFKRA
jgi:hypothetical protein